ncbi:MAG: sigma-70 family RNA polymerase sigma factor [Bacteroidia bacterium]|nr:sigma-70 family RNA polymerase sigma factor [Bacteroidia bacterium]
MNIQQNLITACINGERKAEYELYRGTYSYLMSICIRYTRNQDRAKEVLNVGFLKILTSLNRYNPEVPFKPWIRKIMVNTLINEYKKEKIHYSTMQYVESYHENETYADLNKAVLKIDADQIYAFIAKLPPASQQVFNMYFIDGFKHKEIAEMLNITEGTSKWHLNAAREKLKEMLREIDLPVNLIFNE